MPLILATSLGRKASKICKGKGIEPDILPDPGFGKVKSYHVSVLEYMFEEFTV